MNDLEKLTEQTDNIVARLIRAKKSEQQAKEERLQAECELLNLYKDTLADRIGKTTTFDMQCYKIKVEQKQTFKVDADTLNNIVLKGDDATKTIANTLFRYKVELNKKVFDTLPQTDVAPFYECITTQNSKPSIEIIAKEK